MNIRPAIAASVLIFGMVNPALAQDRSDWNHPDEQRAAAGERLSPRQIYEMGLEYVDSRPTRAKFWFTKLAEQGYAQAQYQLGMVECQLKNYESCARWMSAAGEQGYTDAGLILWQIYFEGRRGVPKDINKACLWEFFYGAQTASALKFCQDSFSKAEFAKIQRKALELRARGPKMKRLN